MSKNETAASPVATMDFTALHEALAAGKTMEEAEAIGRGEAPAPKPKAPTAPAPDGPVGGAE